MSGKLGLDNGLIGRLLFGLNDRLMLRSNGCNE